MDTTQHTPDKHPVLGGKAYVYKRRRSNYWQCAAYLEGYNHRTTTKEEYLHEAIKVFPGSHVKMFSNLLEREGLKYDRDEKARTSYSLRHTYICMRLLEGADIYQIAKNCRTSVEMIEKHYAAHLKNTLDASAINVRKTGYSLAKNQSPKDKTKH